VPSKQHFIKRGIQQTEIDNFLASELIKAGYGGVDIQKNPLGTRIIIYAARPGIVIGRAGKNIKSLTTILEEEYGLENPQIEVNEIEIPELNSRVMASQLVQRLERGDHFRRAAYSILRRVMAAGAKGIEITISGKLTSQRARYQKFRDGVISKAGEPANLFVDYTTIQANMKPGILGVAVKIMRSDAVLPDEVKIVPRMKDAEEKLLKEIKEEGAEPEKMDIDLEKEEIVEEKIEPQVEEVVEEVKVKQKKED
jgi:small subunit ribosomal protein S3